MKSFRLKLKKRNVRLTQREKEISQFVYYLGINGPPFHSLRQQSGDFSETEM